MIELVKELDVPVVRYPGGNFVSGYNWEDGVGPRDQRPRRLDLAWKTTETNQIGTNEFVDWCRLAETDVMLATNLGTRGVDASRNLVEYCNHPKGTYWSDLRRSHGYAEPHAIKDWCLGNELYGDWQIGHKTADEYGRLAAESAKVMKWTDPAIELIVCGTYDMDWDTTVLHHTYEFVDHISMHRYYGNWDGNMSNFLAKSIDLDRYVEQVVSICDFVKAKKKSQKTLMLSLDEWNVWYHNGMDDIENMTPWQVAPPQLEDEYTLADAVLFGSVFIGILKHADRTKSACQAQLINVIAPIMTVNGGAAWRQTIFYPYLHASRHGRGIALDVKPTSPEYPDDEFGSVPYREAVATLKPEEDTVSLVAVNRSQDTPLALRADARDFSDHRIVEHLVLTHEDIHAVNTAERPNTVVPRNDGDAALKDGHIEATLPPVSWNVIRLAPRRLAACRT